MTGQYLHLRVDTLESRETWKQEIVSSPIRLAGLAASSSSLSQGTRRVCGCETTLPSFLKNRILFIHSECHFPPGTLLDTGRRTKWLNQWLSNSAMY